MKQSAFVRAVSLACFVDALDGHAKQAGWMEDLGQGTRNIIDGGWNQAAGGLNAAGQAMSAIPQALASGFKGFTGGNQVQSGGWVGGMDDVYKKQQAELARSNAGQNQLGQGLLQIGDTIGGAFQGFTNGYNGTPSQPQAPQPQAPAPQAAPRPPILAGQPPAPQAPMPPPMPPPMPQAPSPTQGQPASPGIQWQGNSGQAANWQDPPAMPQRPPMQMAPRPPMQMAPRPPQPQQQMRPQYSPEMIAAFRQQHGRGGFDPNSSMDRGKMQQLAQSPRFAGAAAKIAACRPWNKPEFWGLPTTA